MKARPITKAVITYSPVHEESRYHLIIDEKGDIKTNDALPIFSVHPERYPHDAIFIGVITLIGKKSELAEGTLEAFLSSFEGIKIEIEGEASNTKIKSIKDEKKGQNKEE